MKFNRNKMGLVVVVMILALSLIMSGCLGPAGVFRVGGYYYAVASNGRDYTFRVAEIRRDGWILAEFMPDIYVWFNTSQFVRIRERPRPPR